MKVILRADVEKLGHLGDIVNVKPGYGRNYLLPQRLASLATPANIRVFEHERKKLQARMDILRAQAAEVAAKLEGLVVTIPMRVGENDKLYGSVTPAMIGAALAELGVEVDRHRLLLDGSIRTLGEHEVRARLHADVVPSFTVKIVSEEKHIEEAPAEVPAEEAEAEAPAEQA
ncbi:50S ribosomal protein L9 [uncultured Mailhella sp.]|uniref:50S ribosomal protein L9 n=1 Tax=uncultured Mailhella sp. TaxID=1981031 RepID=UPI00262A9F9B|nr:50S ribosomal protein L9 [uncultured Mailhella sp.]